MSPTCVSVNLVGIILLSIHVKNTAFGWSTRQSGFHIKIHLKTQNSYVKMSTYMWIIFHFDEFLDHLFARCMPISHNPSNNSFHIELMWILTSWLIVIAVIFNHRSQHKRKVFQNVLQIFVSHNVRFTCFEQFQRLNYWNRVCWLHIVLFYIIASYSDIDNNWTVLDLFAWQKCISFDGTEADIPNFSLSVFPCVDFNRCLRYD